VKTCIALIFDAVKRVERALPKPVLDERPRQWTERRVRSIWNGEARRIDSYEMSDLEKAAAEEARMNSTPASKEPRGWRRFLPLKTRISMARRLIGFGNSLAAWIAPEWFATGTGVRPHIRPTAVETGALGAMGRILVACEFSGVVRRAFRALGHDAWSCDLVPAEDDSQFHIQGDAIAAAYGQAWDLLIAHPECTYLANSGAKHLYAGMNKANGPDVQRWARMGSAAAFFLAMLNAPVARLAVENPIMLGHPRRLFDIPGPTQTIQPFEYGHGETKATCLWLLNLPPLQPTDIVAGRQGRVWREPPGPERKKNRSRTYEGIAAAMAQQWGSLLSTGQTREGEAEMQAVALKAAA
jgi:hypothetical protein